MKKYPFSARKNAHNIEFYNARLTNLMYDALAVEDHDEYARLDGLRGLVIELLDAIRFTAGYGGVARLTGKQIGFAKEIVMWAENERARKNEEAAIRQGKGAW